MKKVVIAEASPTIKSVADSLLRQNGYDVVCTSDGLQAWEVISAEKPDLVLAGVGLSGISGVELCRQMAGDRLTGGIPVVLMVGAKDSISEEEILASGARGKLRKPFSPKDLLDVVGKLAGSAGGAKHEGDGAAESTPTHAKFVTQVSSTQHLGGKPEPGGLDWTDLNDAKATKPIEKIATFDLSSDDQGLVIEDDQYGLARIPEEESEDEASKRVRDDDYDWFIGEMKKEIEDKAASENKAKPTSSPGPVIASGNGVRFDDIHSSKESAVRSGPPPPSARSETKAEKAVPAAPGFAPRSSASIRPPAPTVTRAQAPPLAEVRSLSEEEISLIADRVAMKLATFISARLDKRQIMEAIRSALKP